MSELSQEALDDFFKMLKSFPAPKYKEPLTYDPDTYEVRDGDGHLRALIGPDTMAAIKSMIEKES